MNELTEHAIEPMASVSIASDSISGETRAIMRKGSKTFSLAALLFDRESREGAELLYTWCRACDDAVDNEPNRARARAKLADLRTQTARAFQGLPSTDLTFTAFSLLHANHDIEEAHAQALLDGMQMDVDQIPIDSEATLELYCYRVAGVVGLMMSKIMGVTDERAFRHAIDTGLAMQMSNIARDIREDFDLGRSYLPGRPTPKSFIGHVYVEPVRELVARAETLYASGEEGLKYLPLRAALAVACAQSLYREIGREVVRRGSRAWDSRTVISFPKKMWLSLKAIANVLASRVFTRI